MILTVDIGNTRTKWALYPLDWQAAPMPQASGLWPNAMIDNEQIACQGSDWDALKKNLSVARQVIVCNVASPALHAPLMAALQDFSWVEVRLFNTGVSCHGLQNGYQQPELLGQDRWASMIGAWHRLHTDCIVINAGSALTLDLIVAEQAGDWPVGTRRKAQHRGGVIVPGLRMMQQALLTNTAQLASRYEASQTVQAQAGLGVSSAQAIDQGVLLAWVGAVQQFSNTVHALTQAHPTCVITGGDADLLAKHLQQLTGFDNNVVTVEHLIFEGLLVAEREQACVG